MIRTIVFDFGNVVAFFDHRRASARLAEHTDMPVAEVHAVIFGGGLEDDYEAGRMDTATFLRTVRERCRLRCSVEQLAASYSDIFWPNTTVGAVLPSLKPAYRLLLLSNTNDLHARHFQVQFADTLRYFDGLVFSHEVGARKPRPAIYAAAQERARCAPNEMLFIDDLPANVAAAQSLGWQGMVYGSDDDMRAGLARHGIVV